MKLSKPNTNMKKLWSNLLKMENGDSVPVPRELYHELVGQLEESGFQWELDETNPSPFLAKKRGEEESCKLVFSSKTLGGDITVSFYEYLVA